MSYKGQFSTIHNDKNSKILYLSIVDKFSTIFHNLNFVEKMLVYIPLWIPLLEDVKKKRNPQRISENRMEKNPLNKG